MRANPALEAARHRRNAARVEAERQRPALRPEVNIVGSQLLRGPEVTFPRGDDLATIEPHSRSRLSVEVEQPLYQFGAGSAASSRSKALAAAGEQEFQRAQLDLALDVKRAYFELLYTQMAERVAAQALDLAREQQRITAALLERERVARLELLEAERGVAEAEAALVGARNGALLARGELNRLLGRPVGATLAITPMTNLPPEPPPTEQLLPEALRERPEAIAMETGIQSAEAGVRLARAERLPRASLQGGYDLQTPSAFVPRSSWRVAVEITAPLFETARIRYNVREAEEQLAALRSEQEALAQGIALEIHAARLAMDEAGKRHELALRMEAAAAEAQRLVQLRFELLRTTPAELAGARLALSRAQLEGARAFADVWIARARLERALGAPLPPQPSAVE
ncbi:MAG: TolC family protein [Armatimonadetes bacterium]|nr:TolC family protein [Armatimonadota bacterium]